MASPTPTSVAGTGTAPARDAEVLRGMSFLVNPTTSTYPLHERIQFLQTKAGLTPAEVLDAVKRASEFGLGLGPGSNPLAAFPQPDTNGAAGASVVSWKGLAALATMAGAGVAAGAASGLLRPGSLAPAGPVVAEPDNALHAKVDSLCGDIARLAEVVSQQATTLNGIMEQLGAIGFMQRQLADIKVDLNTIKASTTPPTIARQVSSQDVNDHFANLQPVTAAPGPIGVEESKASAEAEKDAALAQSAKKAIEKLSETHGASFVPASRALTMYVTNLLEADTNPRYRRVSTTNSQYTKSLGTIQDIGDLLRIIGFELKGSTWEWTAPGGMDSLRAKAFLQSVIEALNQAAATSQRSSTPSPVASESGVESGTDARTLSREVSTSSPAALASPMSSVASMAAQWSAAPPQVPQPVAAPAPAPSPSPSPAEPSVAAAAAQPVVVESPEQQPSTPVEQPPPPTDLAEIAAMLDQGKTLPGIRAIEERLSSSSTQLLSEASTPARKPWDGNASSSSSSAAAATAASAAPYSSPATSAMQAFFNPTLNSSSNRRLFPETGLATFTEAIAAVQAGHVAASRNAVQTTDT